MFQPKFLGAGPRARNRSRVAFGADDFAGGLDKPSGDQGNVPYSGSEVENTLPCAHARCAEESFRVRAQPCRLTNETFLFGSVTAEGVFIGIGADRHRTD